MIAPPTPDSTIEAALGQVFGSPSLVVSTFAFANALWAWWSLARGSVTAADAIFNRTHDSWGIRTLKVRSTFRLTIAWVGLYASASFVTQIWSGSPYSPGQGGGIEELLTWSALFGATAVGGCLFLIPAAGPKHTDPGWAPYWGLVGGYVVGAIWAVTAFTIKGGPTSGDWWVCPALSCIGVLGSALRLRIRALSRRP